jgi:3-phytase
MTFKSIIFYLLLLGTAGKNLVAQELAKIKDKAAEAREDSLQWANALHMQSKFTVQLCANAETQPVISESGADAADDPAIWPNPQDPDRSLVLGTNKKGGLCVYDVNGKQLQFIAAGRLNNVDLRDGFTYQNKPVVLVAASNRNFNSISLFYIDPQTGVVSDTIANIPSKVGEVHGLCMYRNIQNNLFYAIVNGKDGKIEQWEITSTRNKINYKLTRNFAVVTQPEGMVADDETGMLYLGVEDEGIYSANLNNQAFALTLIKESTEENPAIKYDIEGLSFFNYQNHKYLVVSSQGNFSYALFNVTMQPVYMKSFVITDQTIDGTEETDGLDITLKNCGKNFPDGVLVVQDGKNMNGDKEENQNFKIINALKIISILK